jgi:hypothetical protein
VPWASKTVRALLLGLAGRLYFIACGASGAWLVGGNLEWHLTTILGAIAGFAVGIFLRLLVERRMVRRLPDGDRDADQHRDRETW